MLFLISLIIIYCSPKTATFSIQQVLFLSFFFYFYLFIYLFLWLIITWTGLLDRIRCSTWISKFQNILCVAFSIIIIIIISIHTARCLFLNWLLSTGVWVTTTHSRSLGIFLVFLLTLAVFGSVWSYFCL